MSQAAREALWARERTEAPRAFGPDLPHARKPKERRAYPSQAVAAMNRRELKPWGVFRVNDDGRVELAKPCASRQEATDEAGRMRDRSTEGEISAGWNYLSRKRA